MARISDQVGMAFHRVGCKIGKIDLVLTAVMLDHQVLTIEAGIDPKPELAVIARNRLVILPAFLISSSSGVADKVPAVEIPDVRRAEIEPLVKLGLIVLANIE